MPETPASPGTEALLRQAGLRVTNPRRVIYEALLAMPHASADEMFAKVLETLPGTSIQAVYNVLGDLVNAGLARRIEPSGQPGLFEARVGDNHHHVVCTSCGRVDDIECVTGEPPCMHPANTGGYQIHTAEVTFWGLCSGCASAETEASALQNASSFSTSKKGTR